MDSTHLIIYSVCGVVGVVAIVVALVAAYLLHKEKLRSKTRSDKKTEKKKPPLQQQKSTTPSEGKKKLSAYPSKFRTTTEVVQPLTDSELLRPPSRPEQEDRSKSSMSQSFRRQKTVGEGYKPLEDATTDDSDVDGTGLFAEIKKSSLPAGALLGIPFQRNSLRSSSISASSADEDHQLNKSDQSLNKKEDLGKIYFTLNYEFESQSLILRINRATDLVAKDIGGTSDPYVRIMLLPDKKHKLQTKVKHKCLDPIWNETFMFEGFPFDKLSTRTLHLEVLDHDRFTADDPIGEVFVPLLQLNLAQTQELEMNLKVVDPDRYRLGEILLSLTYDPNYNRLTLTIQKCKDLKATDINGKSDPYVKVWLIKKGHRVEKRKTVVKKRNLNPVFNESFSYEVPLTRLREVQLLIIVRDHDVIGSNDTIGSVLLGAQSGPTESKHWNEMLIKPRVPTAMWHVLRKKD